MEDTYRTGYMFQGTRLSVWEVFGAEFLRRKEDVQTGWQGGGMLFQNPERGATMSDRGDGQ